MGVHVCVGACGCMYVYICVCTCVYVHPYGCACMCSCVCRYVYVYIRVCVCACMSCLFSCDCSLRNVFSEGAAARPPCPPRFLPTPPSWASRAGHSYQTSPRSDRAGRGAGCTLVGKRTRSPSLRGSLFPHLWVSSRRSGSVSSPVCDAQNWVLQRNLRRLAPLSGSRWSGGDSGPR